MAIRLRCPKCRQAFPWESGKELPDECQLCHEYIGPDPDRDVTVITAPFIRSQKMKAVDDVYRQTEAGSETRMKIAAELTGAPVSEMTSLKITDMKDNQREGDIAAKEAPVQLGQFFQPNGAQYMAGNAQGAVTVNGKITTGIAPRAGASAVTNLRRAMGQGSWDVATIK